MRAYSPIPVTGKQSICHTHWMKRHEAGEFFGPLSETQSDNKIVRL